MPYVTVGQENSGPIRLHYEDHGQGEPVVLIHGWPLSGRSWEKQVPVLVRAGFRVITYDRRGFGESSRPVSGYDFDRLAQDLKMFLEELNITNATLVGFSMGGGEVARYLAKFGSGRVKRAAFVSSVAPFLLKTDDNPEGVDASVFQGIQAALADDRPAFLTKFLKDFYNADKLKGSKISEEAIHLSGWIASIASPMGTIECVSSWQEDLREDVRKLDVPTLVVHGDADRIVPAQASDAEAREELQAGDDPGRAPWLELDARGRA